MKRFAFLALMLFSLNGWSITPSNNWCVFANGVTTLVNHGTTLPAVKTYPAPSYAATNCTLNPASGTYGTEGYKPAFYSGCQCPDNMEPNCTIDGSCPEISDTATFKFKIESGGYDANLYVCGVCIKKHVCLNCGKDKDDTIKVYATSTTPGGADTLLETIVNETNGDGKCKEFSQAQHASYANVFLNSAEYGSGWYVKYCLNIVHGVAGGIVDGLPSSTTDYISLNDTGHQFGINGLVTVTPGNAGAYTDNGYLVESGLQFAVNHYCGSNGGFVGEASGADSIFWDDLLPWSEETLNTGKRICVNETGSDGCFQTRNVCAWEVHFQESKRCPRKLKEHCEGADCKLFYGEVNTSVKATIKPTCTDC